MLGHIFSTRVCSARNSHIPRFKPTRGPMRSMHGAWHMAHEPRCEAYNDVSSMTCDLCVHQYAREPSRDYTNATEPFLLYAPQMPDQARDQPNDGMTPFKLHLGFTAFSPRPRASRFSQFLPPTSPFQLPQLPQPPRPPHSARFFGCILSTTPFFLLAKPKPPLPPPCITA